MTVPAAEPPAGATARPDLSASVPPPRQPVAGAPVPGQYTQAPGQPWSGQPLQGHPWSGQPVTGPYAGTPAPTVMPLPRRGHALRRRLPAILAVFAVAVLGVGGGAGLSYLHGRTDREYLAE